MSSSELAGWARGSVQRRFLIVADGRKGFERPEDAASGSAMTIFRRRHFADCVVPANDIILYT